MKLFGLFLSVFLVFFSLGAAGAINDFPSTITFFEENQTVNFTITNNSAVDGRILVEFFAPVESAITAPLNIKAGKDANVSIILSPKKELLGQQYESLLVVKIGATESRQSSRLFFRSIKEKPVLPNDTNFSGAVTGIVSFFSGFASDLALDILLILIVLVLAIAFFARVIKRIK